ncbi:hypothetical protein KEM54_002873 [Ascosphaera aggregata]|nr:hypothetical protein KEM54_002873 [Ascosphaera aggregata]
MYFQSRRTSPTSMPISFETKAAPTTSLSPEDSTSKIWSGHSSTFTSSSWATCNSSLPTPSVCGSCVSTVASPKKSYFSITPEESRSNISCAFPSWPSRTALYAENESVSTPSAYISDEDLLWSCTPSSEYGSSGNLDGSNGASTAYQPVSPAPEVIDPRVAAIASLDEDEQARKFRAAQKHAMKLAQMAMIAAAEQRGTGGKRRKTTRVVMSDRRRRTTTTRRP